MPEEYDPNMIKETKIKPYFYYGNQKFSSLEKAVNFALSHIVKIKGNVTPQERLKQSKQAKRRIMAAIYEGKKYGNNKITNKKEDTFIKLFIESLGDPIIKILLSN